MNSYTSEFDLNSNYKLAIPSKYLPTSEECIKSQIEKHYKNSTATADESMAIEALSQLGNSTIFPRIETKTPLDLPLLTCSMCDRQFRTTADLQNHQAICKDTQYKCQVCGVIFGRKFFLNNHLICHAIERPYSCTICGILFIGKVDLIEHMQGHGDVLFINQCQVCGVIFNRPSSLSNHMKIHNYQPGRAIYNSDIIVDVEQILKVEDDANKKKSLPSISNIKTSNAWFSLNTLNKAVDKAGEKSLNCKICQTDFRQEKVYKLHQKMAHGLEQSVKKPNKHGCTECGKKFATKQKVQRHMWIHRKKTYSCEFCTQNFEVKDDLDLHRLSLHQQNTESSLTCKECGKQFSSRQGLWEHGRIHGPSPQSFICIQCSKTFSSRQGYLIHKRIHNDERPYGCKFCKKAFRDGGTLRKHERIHTGERPHACPLCPKAFNQKVVLREHVRWLHAANINTENGGIYECLLCKDSFTDRDELCSHIVRHSDENSKKRDKIKGVPTCNINTMDGNDLLDFIQ